MHKWNLVLKRCGVKDTFSNMLAARKSFMNIKMRNPHATTESSHEGVKKVLLVRFVLADLAGSGNDACDVTSPTISEKLGVE